MEHNNIHVNGKKNTLTDIMKMKCLLLRFYSIYCYLKKERKKEKNYTHNFCLQLNCITEYISYENIILGNKFWYLNE